MRADVPKLAANTVAVLKHWRKYFCVNREPLFISEGEQVIILPAFKKSLIEHVCRVEYRGQMVLLYESDLQAIGIWNEHPDTMTRQIVRP